jgi:hypothetical protein
VAVLLQRPVPPAQNCSDKHRSKLGPAEALLPTHASRRLAEFYRWIAGRLQAEKAPRVVLVFRIAVHQFYQLTCIDGFPDTINRRGPRQPPSAKARGIEPVTFSEAISSPIRRHQVEKSGLKVDDSLSNLSQLLHGTRSSEIDSDMSSAAGRTVNRIMFPPEISMLL